MRWTRDGIRRLVHACRVPATVPSGTRGAWTIARSYMPLTDAGIPRWTEDMRRVMGLDEYDSYTLLYRLSEAIMHQPPGEIVMEDSPRELRRHLPILLPAWGRVFVSGLGLGCVVRGLLSKPEVERVDVVEVDRNILDLVGPEFQGNPRVRLIYGDALTVPIDKGVRYQFAWHDVWSEDEALHLVHARLLLRYYEYAMRQGAWMLPRYVRRAMHDKRGRALLL